MNVAVVIPVFNAAAFVEETVESVLAQPETGEVLLLDEVLAVGDASFKKKCFGKMGEVAKEGRTCCS